MNKISSLCDKKDVALQCFVKLKIYLLIGNGKTVKKMSQTIRENQFEVIAVYASIQLAFAQIPIR